MSHCERLLSLVYLFKFKPNLDADKNQNIFK